MIGWSGGFKVSKAPEQGKVRVGGTRRDLFLLKNETRSANWLVWWFKVKIKRVGWLVWQFQGLKRHTEVLVSTLQKAQQEQGWVRVRETFVL